MPPARLKLRRLGLEHLASCATPEVTWVANGRQEPPLVELLEDPMMALLWASDGLDPAAGRATVRALQALVRDRSRRERQAWRGRREAGTPDEDLAA
jgi:hypothetical protein